MESNNIITAPQIDGFDYFYSIWVKNHVESEKSFYEFMTTPSTEREEFINSLGKDVSLSFIGGVAEVTLREDQ